MQTYVCAFGRVRFIVDGCFSGVSVRRGSTVLRGATEMQYADLYSVNVLL